MIKFLEQLNNKANDRKRVDFRDNRWVNHSTDLADGYDATQNANYRNYTAYWLKWLQSWEYDQIKDTRSIYL